MEATANAPVSWSVPTLTKPVLRPKSTTNPKHLGQFVAAKHWNQILP
jgi:hypothetical protein